MNSLISWPGTVGFWISLLSPLAVWSVITYPQRLRDPSTWELWVLEVMKYTLLIWEYDGEFLGITVFPTTWSTPCPTFPTKETLNIQRVTPLKRYEKSPPFHPPPQKKRHTCTLNPNTPGGMAGSLFSGSDHLKKSHRLRDVRLSHPQSST